MTESPRQEVHSTCTAIQLPDYICWKLCSWGSQVEEPWRIRLEPEDESLHFPFQCPTCRLGQVLLKYTSVYATNLTRVTRCIEMEKTKIPFCRWRECNRVFRDDAASTSSSSTLSAQCSSSSISPFRIAWPKSMRKFQFNEIKPCV